MNRYTLCLLVLGLCLSPAARASSILEIPGFLVLESRPISGGVEHHVSYRSETLDVRAYVYLAETPEPRPLIVFNHGGINGVSADMKRRSVDLVQAGYTVIAPAYRGEGGGDGRVEVAAGEVKDVIVATRLMRGSPRVDPARIGIIGSSHGALISVLAAARQPVLYACVAASCGVMDVTAWYGWLIENDFDVSDSLTVAVYGHGPDDKPQAFAVRRAVSQAKNLYDPLFLQYGLLDRIVPVDQGLAMQGALLEASHAPFTLTSYPRLGHAFWFWNDLTRHSTADIDQANASWTALLQFLETHLSP